MSYKILVTGGAGYIGSILVPELLRLGHSVTVLDNFMYRANSLAPCCADPNFSVVNGDVRNSKLLNELAAKNDVIIPLAALVGAPLCAKDPDTASAVNREAPISMFTKLSADQWVLMPTTNSGYGTGNPGTYLDEKSPLNPLSLYAKDKVEVENALMTRKNSVSFRLATVFGMSPRMRIDLLVNEFTYRACYDRCVVLFEAHFKRNYLHVRDVANAFIFSMNQFDKVRGEIFNVGLSDANLSKMELCKCIQTQIPEFTFLEASVGKDPDQRNYLISNEKIEKAGYRTQVSLADGIKELIKGFTMIKNSVYGNV